MVVRCRPPRSITCSSPTSPAWTAPRSSAGWSTCISLARRRAATTCTRSIGNTRFRRIAPGEVSDRWADEPVFTLYGLRHRAAEYFEQVRLPRENWKTIEDLAPQLAEFDLRCEGQDYETAGDVLTGDQLRLPDALGLEPPRGRAERAIARRTG